MSLPLPHPPPAISRLLYNLTKLALDDNQFEGLLPNLRQMDATPFIDTLDVSLNGFRGVVDSKWKNIRSLTLDVAGEAEGNRFWCSDAGESPKSMDWAATVLVHPCAFAEKTVMQVRERESERERKREGESLRVRCVCVFRDQSSVLCAL